MVATVTVLTVVVGLLIGTIVVLAGRLSGAIQRLDDVADLARVNAEVMEMRTRETEHERSRERQRLRQ